MPGKPDDSRRRDVRQDRRRHHILLNDAYDRQFVVQIEGRLGIGVGYPRTPGLCWTLTDEFLGGSVLRGRVPCARVEIELSVLLSVSRWPTDGYRPTTVLIAPRIPVDLIGGDAARLQCLRNDVAEESVCT